MATYKSIVEFRGKVGDLVFYNYWDKQVVRMNSFGPGERFKYAPSYARARENSAEFGGASMAGGLIRKGMGPVLKMKPEGKLPSQLTKLCRQLLEMGGGPSTCSGTAVRGQRPVELCRHAAVLEGLHSEGGNLSIVNGGVVHSGPVPAGATHVRAVLQFFTLCDVVYDPELKKYKPVAEQKHEMVTFDATPLRGKGEMVVAPHIRRAMANCKFQIANEAVVVMCAVLVAFMKVVNGIEYDLEGGKSWVVMANCAQRAGKCRMANEGEGIEEGGEVFEHCIQGL